MYFYVNNEISKKYNIFVKNEIINPFDSFLKNIMVPYRIYLLINLHLSKTEIPKKIKPPVLRETLYTLFLGCHASSIGHQMLFFLFTYVTYGKPCYAIFHQVIYGEFYGFAIASFTLRHLFLDTLSWFQCFCGSSSSVSNTAGLCVEFQNTVPEQLFV